METTASDPFIWEQHPASDRFKRDVFSDFYDKGIACDGALLIIDNQTDALIGSTRYYEYDEARLEIVVGYTFFAQSPWGEPYNRARKRLMLDYAFEHVATVALYAGPDNYRPCGAIKKIGGVEDGRITQPDGSVSVRYIVRRIDI